MSLIEKLKNHEATIGVIGLGYVGLPLIVEFARAGFDAVGIDVDHSKVSEVNAGRSYIGDVATETLSEVVNSGKLRATTDFSVLADVDTLNICVPTPLRKTRDPDISYVVNAVEEVRKYLHEGQLIILESTTYPGTTEEVILPILADSGLEVGVDYYLAFSPERVDPGNEKYGTRNIPKVVGGVSEACTEVACELYRSTSIQTVPVSSTNVSETVKLLESMDVPAVL